MSTLRTNFDNRMFPPWRMPFAGQPDPRWHNLAPLCFADQAGYRQHLTRRERRAQKRVFHDSETARDLPRAVTTHSELRAPMSGNNDEPCSTCGGDKRIANSFGSLTSCPSCRGTGRRVADEPRFHDVTKTKPSHHGTPASRAAAAKPTAPVTPEGIQLAGEVQASTMCAADTKARLVREIMDHESTHGRCTQTFIKKVRKQVRPAT